jgi:diadenosine tetraphosphate (Ap4A) HIT family hydrolase
VSRLTHEIAETVITAPQIAGARDELHVGVREGRAPDSAECRLCAQIAGRAESDLVHELLGGVYRRPVVLESARFAAMPSVGAVATGHVLLSPKRHVRSFAALSAAETDDALECIQGLTDRLLSAFGGPVQLFEHGNATCGSKVACSVEHAHLHFLPAIPDLWPAPRLSVEWATLSSLSDLSEHTRGREYLSLRTADGAWRVAACPTGTHVPSQLLRRHAAALVGRGEEWNWREYPAVDLLRLTRDTLRPVAGPPC